MNYKKVIIKIGTSTLSDDQGNLDHMYIRKLVEQVSMLKKQGITVLLVTSGAVGAGKSLLPSNKKTPDTLQRQMLAAVGQVQLMSHYQHYFQKHQILTAQVLLTLDDFHNRQRYLNIRNCLQQLIDHNVIPIINENDVVATEEITGVKIGDNDTLSAYVAASVDADLLILLSDVDGLFTNNPLKDKKATLIRKVDHVDATLDNMVDDSVASKVFFGGMKAKINAAKIATANGTELVIAHGVNPNIIQQIIEGKETKSTRFLPTQKQTKNRKKWLVSKLDQAKASLVIDENAEKALLANKSLLPVGITKVKGKAKRGDPVNITNENNTVIAKGLIEYSLDAIEKIKRKHSKEIIDTLGYTYGNEVIHRDNLVVIQQNH